MENFHFLGEFKDDRVVEGLQQDGEVDEMVTVVLLPWPIEREACCLRTAPGIAPPSSRCHCFIEE
jgi:hypothetical protein